MKPPYFADNRDLFKFDLAQTLISKSQRQLNQIYYIPMLTPNNTGTDGGQTDRSKAKAGYKNIRLMKYLDDCISTTGRRNIKEIKQYYHSENVKIDIYQEDGYFKHTERLEYFNQIDQGLLNNSLILVDPDNGMEVKSSDEKHILFDELKMLYNNMNEISVMMIFQYFPQEEHKGYIIKRIKDITERIITSCEPHLISDNDIIYYLVSKTPIIEESIINIIRKYKEYNKDSDRDKELIIK